MAQGSVGGGANSLQAKTGARQPWWLLPQNLAIPGFVGGVVFAFLLWIAEGRRRFDELSLPRFGLWGAAVGALLGLFALGLGAASGVLPLWLRATVIVAPSPC